MPQIRPRRVMMIAPADHRPRGTKTTAAKRHAAATKTAATKTTAAVKSAAAMPAAAVTSTMPAAHVRRDRVRRLLSRGR